METYREGKREKVSTSRRKFLKKAAYTAPTLMILGSLAKSEQAQADFGSPPSLDPTPPTP